MWNMYNYILIYFKLYISTFNSIRGSFSRVEHRVRSQCLTTDFSMYQMPVKPKHVSFMLLYTVAYNLPKILAMSIWKMLVTIKLAIPIILSYSIHRRIQSLPTQMHVGTGGDTRLEILVIYFFGCWGGCMYFKY